MKDAIQVGAPIEIVHTRPEREPAERSPCQVGGGNGGEAGAVGGRGLIVARGGARSVDFNRGGGSRGEAGSRGSWREAELAVYDGRAYICDCAGCADAECLRCAAKD